MSDKENKDNKRSFMSPFSFRGLLAYILLFIVLGLLLTGFAGKLNPVTWSWLSLGGYVFPVFLAAAVFSVILCVFICKRLIVIPVAGLLLAYLPTSLYCPINKSQDVPDDAFTLLSFNTYNWARDNEQYKDMRPNVVVDYLMKSDADLVCLQEAIVNNAVEEDINNILRTKYKYIDTIVGRGNGTLAVVSRYPIVRKQHIDYETVGNVTGAFWIDINGREVIVINNHLQTTGLSIKDRQAFGDMMHGKNEDTDEIKNTSKTVFGKILAASRIRSGQAEAVTKFIRTHSGQPIIVCGDFNDIPHSYTYNRMINPGKGVNGEEIEMTDCYRQTGFGPGYTYGHFAMRVRIDNILCTKQFTPYNCTVDDSLTCSDHYPVKCRLTLH